MNSKYKSRISLLYSSLDIILVGLIMYDFGFATSFQKDFQFQRSLGLLCFSLLLMGFNYFRLRYHKQKYHRVMLLIYNVVLSTMIITAVGSLVIHHWDFVKALSCIGFWLEIQITVYFILRLVRLIKKLYKLYHNPAVLFAGSFGLLVFVGTLLLMLPNSTTHGISFVDALFTSTSAVCVTGLIVLDTAKDFTQQGHIIIMMLFQLGGLGMLTFTSFFAFFFKSGSSFREGLFMKDYVGSGELSDALSAGWRIVVFTLFLESVGAVLIYCSINNNPLIEDKIFFSIFHSISAFCNAGFSLFSDGLATPGIDHAYTFQWVIMLLIVCGGLGYVIVENTLVYIKELIKKIFTLGRLVNPIRTLTLNTKIVCVTTFVLILSGTLFILVVDYDVFQAHDSLWGKITQAAFTSVTMRTAGFNTYDLSLLTVPSWLFCIFLMWVGASPGSTGGGIKTSSFAIAVLNIMAIARGRNHIEIGTRRLSNDSVRRAFSIIFISFAVIFIAVFCLTFFEKDFDLVHLSFEVFSAYSTVGTSLGVTPLLSIGGKYTIIIVMFLGRIGTINLLIGLMAQEDTDLHRYPEDNILIN